MTAGRKPKPTAQRKLGGNAGKRALNTAEPQYAPAGTRVPKDRLPPEAARLWRALAGPMAQAGILKVTDLPALEMLCLHYAVGRAALAELLKAGKLEVENADGKVFAVSEGIAVTAESAQGIKKHPAAAVFKENSLAFRAYLSEFGLTPSSRARIQTPGGEEELSLADALFQVVKDSQ